MTTKLLHESDIEKLSEKDIEDKLSYVSETLKILRHELGDKYGLLGFCGSPWTLACYMIEGGSEMAFPKLWHGQKKSLFPSRLLEKITQALIEYLRMQAKCGVDALQIFDSWHNLCPEKLWEYSLQWIAEMIKNIPKELSIIVYANSSTSGISQILRTGSKAVGVHHRAELSAIRKQFPSPVGFKW